MKMRWISPGDDKPPTAAYPHGYWYASTDDGRNDGAGLDPLSAVCELIAQIETERKRA